jgi:hypothetical protein
MPKVGGKHFPYTEAGYAAARKAAKKTKRPNPSATKRPGGPGVGYGKLGKPGMKTRMTRGR